MSEVIKRITLALIIGLCITGLSLHLAVESLGGQTQETFHSHEEDQFVLSEPGSGNPAQRWASRPFAYQSKAVSRPLPPARQPPKPI